MAVIRLTQKIIDAQEWAGKVSLLRDAKTPGLMLVVNKHTMSWKVQADLWQRKKLVKDCAPYNGDNGRLNIGRGTHSGPRGSGPNKEGG